MSRSYGKFAPGFTMRDWYGSMRTRERQCICKEMRNDEYGEVIFPIVSEVSDPWSDDCGNCLYLKEEIRDEYFSEIKNILNGYDDHFLEYFSRIKGILPSNGKGSWYEWLNLKEAKTVIKKWEGDPLDVLYYLTNAKIIEKAVNCEFYKRNRK